MTAISCAVAFNLGTPSSFRTAVGAREHWGRDGNQPGLFHRARSDPGIVGVPVATTTGEISQVHFRNDHVRERI